MCIKFKLSSEAEECIRATAPRPEGQDISVKRTRPIRPGPRGDQLYFFHINGSFAASEAILLASEYHITSLLGLYTVQ